MYLELVSGGSLEDVMYPTGGEQTQLSLFAAHNYGNQILSGLEYLHANAVIHRDLKPGNFLVTTEGELKLADFGASFDMGSMTRNYNQTTVGTPMYMAPEVVIRDNHTTASDVWSFGVMMFEMVTGKLPFESKNAPRLMLELAAGTLDIEWPKFTSLPDHFRDLIERCLLTNPSARPTVTQLLKHPFFTTKIEQVAEFPPLLDRWLSESVLVTESDDSERSVSYVAC